MGSNHQNAHDGHVMTPMKPSKPDRAANSGPSGLRAGDSPLYVIDLTGDSSQAPKRKASDNSRELASSAKKAKTDPTEEKRLRRFRPYAPQAFRTVYHRAMGQRFFVLKRTRCGTDECPEEVVEMTGSTGNIYTVRIGLVPECNCPHALAGNQCKHVIYVMTKVLNAPYDLVFQLALLSSELRRIFAAAPPISTPDTEKSDKRKPIEGDCPICYCELEATGAEAVVWCRAACGQNIHKQCIQMWARARPGNVTCPMCRSVWEDNQASVSMVRKEDGDIEEGYVNVADQLGISRERVGMGDQDILMIGDTIGRAGDGVVGEVLLGTWLDIGHHRFTSRIRALDDFW